MLCTSTWNISVDKEPSTNPWQHPSSPIATFHAERNLLLISRMVSGWVDRVWVAGDLVVFISYLIPSITTHFLITSTYSRSTIFSLTQLFIIDPWTKPNTTILLCVKPVCHDRKHEKQGFGIRGNILMWLVWMRMGWTSTPLLWASLHKGLLSVCWNYM